MISANARLLNAINNRYFNNNTEKECTERVGFVLCHNLVDTNKFNYVIIVFFK